APGTTFKRHMAIAKGVLNEDETLLREILFNPHTVDQVAKIREELKNLIEIIDNKDPEALAQFIARIKANALR
ncbi:MAG: prephenate dehydrogenase/arogenate dehydrogenase family protein, partial [Bacteroidaceae bacterium]